MAKIVKEDEPFERIEEPRQRAMEICRDLGQSLKVEHINEGLADEATVSFYRQGEFIDLCRGPHVPSAGAIGAFKLLSVAGAYWKGDASRQQLQRLYATAWFDKQDLEAYLQQVEEAKRRDHRVLGRQLELFTIDPMVGSGLILWLPKGATFAGNWRIILCGELLKRNYEPVYTPHIGRVELYETSGHYPYYAESQFPPIQMADGERYLLKPMNCPHHIMIYQSKPRSYRDLPLRLAEFGTVYRFEQSGELGGMTRVRGFTQDDAHLFCTEEQVADEFRGCVEMTQMVLTTLGLDDYRVRLGFRDPASDKYVGGAETWQRAEAALEAVCRQMNLPNVEVERGEAAFYGPKADFLVADCHRPRVAAGHRAVGLQPAQRGALRPGIHRAGQPAPSAGDDPPGAVRVVRAVRGDADRAFRRGLSPLAGAGAGPRAVGQREVRALRPRPSSSGWRKPGCGSTGDYRAEKIGAKIRDAQLELIPYMFVVGGREMDTQAVAVRDRLEGDLGGMSARGGPGETPRGDPGQARAASGEDLGRVGPRRGERLLRSTRSRSQAACRNSQLRADLITELTDTVR